MLRIGYLPATCLSTTMIVFALNPLKAAPTLGEIKKSLICTCECSMTVEACEGSMACNAAKLLTDQARDLILKGLTIDEILSNFTARFGESILAAPPKRGFNLIAWVLPLGATILSAFGIVVVLRRWTARASKEENTETAINIPENDNSMYEKELDEILRRME